MWEYCMLGNTRKLGTERDTCRIGNKKQKSREFRKIEDRPNLGPAV